MPIQPFFIRVSQQDDNSPVIAAPIATLLAFPVLMQADPMGQPGVGASIPDALNALADLKRDAAPAPAAPTSTVSTPYASNRPPAPDA